MAGTYQHYLQRMLQSGFKCSSSGKRFDSVWVYPKGEKPYRRRVDKLGGEDEFYSPTSDGTSITLDDRISSWESHRQADIRAWRQIKGDSLVDTRKAAELVGLTGVRTRALRQSFKSMFEKILPKFGRVISDPDVLMAHIDDRKEIDAFLETSVATELGYNQEDFNQIRENIDFLAIMRILKYIISEVMGHRLSIVLRELDKVFTEALDSDVFNAAKFQGKAISKLLDDGGARNDLLSLSWSIIERNGCSEWILPDCAVLSVSKDGNFSPFIFGNSKERSAVLLPLSSNKILVGLESGQAIPNLLKFNSEAAKCSQQFFIASSQDLLLENLQSEIGKTEKGEVLNGLEIAISQIDPLIASHEPAVMPSLADMSVSTYGLEIDEAGLSDVAEPLCQLIFSSARNFNLSRLKQVVFCGHVADAIGNRLSEPTAPYEEEDCRAFMSWIECGDGSLAYEFFIHIDAVNILLKPNNEHHDFVFNIFLRSLAHMHTRAVLASAGANRNNLLENLTQEPVGTYARDTATAAALTFMDNVHGCRIEEPDNDFAKTSATKLEVALEKFQSSPIPRDGSEEERNDSAEALSIAAQDLLVSASRHLGVCQILGLNPLDDTIVSPKLLGIVEKIDLHEWIARLDFDLQRLRVNFVTPLDPERIIYLQRHLERLYWARGTILTASEEGGYIMPFADANLTYRKLKDQMKTGIEEMFPDNLTDDILKLFE